MPGSGPGFIGAISDSYLNLGLHDDGIRLTQLALATIEKARPRDDVEVAGYIDKVINGYGVAGQWDKVPPYLDRAIALLEGSPKRNPALQAGLVYRRRDWPWTAAGRWRPTRCSTSRSELPSHSRRGIRRC
jgi:hypothetical protein